jgi:hypothetical protein
MRRCDQMSNEEKTAALAQLQFFIESAVESEQDEPAEFKPETEHRIDLILVNLKELLGIRDMS